MTADSVFTLSFAGSLLIAGVTVWRGQQSILTATLRTLAMPLFITTLWWLCN